VVALGITVGGMLGAAGSLNALTMALSRVPAALAEDGFLPRSSHAAIRRRARRWAIAGCAAAWALGLMLPFSKLLMLDMLLTGSSILLEFAALVALRIREPNLARLTACPADGRRHRRVHSASRPHGPHGGAQSRRAGGAINALQFGGILMALGVVAYFVGGSSETMIVAEAM